MSDGWTLFAAALTVFFTAVVAYAVVLETHSNQRACLEINKHRTATETALLCGGGK